MSNGRSRESEKRRRPSCSRSIYRVHYGLQRRDDDEVTACPMTLPFSASAAELRAYSRQVAGHMKTDKEKYLGVLQCSNGTILKPIIKDSQKREVDFYERVTSSSSDDLKELRQFIPAYYGARKLSYGGCEQRYIVLADLAAGVCEPCIMDVKIGKRTWDPLASEEKIKREQSKYAKCKLEYGFCIPGFQVYNVTTGKLKRYDKEYGKKLHGQGVINALRTYLNGHSTPLCRSLLLQILTQLWRIEQWLSKQTRLKLYSTSLLIVYDAARLRECCFQGEDGVSVSNCRQLRTRRNSVHCIAGSNFSGQLTANGPVYKKVNSVPITPISFSQTSFSLPKPISSPWSEALTRLHQNHSFDHNYDDKLSRIKINYRALLDQLSTERPNKQPWATVKIIDFAHAFFNEEGDDSRDENFKEGVDSLVKIFEEFLSETDEIF